MPAKKKINKKVLRSVKDNFGTSWMLVDTMTTSATLNAENGRCQAQRRF